MRDESYQTMFVWAIPEEIGEKLWVEHQKRQRIFEEGIEFVKEQTGLAVTGIATAGELFFSIEEGQSIPYYLKGTHSKLSPRKNTTKGRSMDAEWHKRFERPLPWFLCGFEITGGGTIRAKMETIKGKLYIVDSAGIDLEASGCTKISIEDAVNAT